MRTSRVIASVMSEPGYGDRDAGRLPRGLMKRGPGGSRRTRLEQEGLRGSRSNAAGGSRNKVPEAHSDPGGSRRSGRGPKPCPWVDPRQALPHAFGREPLVAAPGCVRGSVSPGIQCVMAFGPSLRVSRLGNFGLRRFSLGDCSAARAEATAMVFRDQPLQANGRPPRPAWRKSQSQIHLGR